MKKLISILLISMTVFVVGCGDKKEAPKQDTKAVEQSEKQETKEEVKQELPLIDFTGKVSPSVLTKGNDGTVSVKVTNKGEKDINGIRLLFSNNDLVTKGLIIKNVVNGKVSEVSNRSFEWPDLTIKPNETAELKIELQANEQGQYDNVITIQPVGSSQIYKASDGNAELHYKFKII